MDKSFGAQFYLAHPVMSAALGDSFIVRLIGDVNLPATVN